jgi:hypothetical protein
LSIAIQKISVMSLSYDAEAKHAGLRPASVYSSNGWP